ncbi:MAG: phosphatidylglycerophosphatase A [Thermodesulfovibrionales bacterium]
MPPIKRLLTHIATIGPVGRIPFAPGTFGSLVCLLLLGLLQPSPAAHSAIIAVSLLIGIPSAAAAEAFLGEKDSGRIVIDEFAGYAVATLGLPLSAPVLSASFLSFRGFDIYKPLGIRRMERLFHGGAGVMADDILAGVYANLSVRIGVMILQNLQG